MMVPIMTLMIATHLTGDPARRPSGYGGVLLVPGVAAPTPSSTNRVDPILDTHHDTRADARAERGRVLYSNDRTARNVTSAPSSTPATRPARKVPCPERRVGQGRVIPASPTT